MAVNSKIRILLFLNSLQKRLDMSAQSPETFRLYAAKNRGRLKSLAQFPPEKLFHIHDEQVNVSNGAKIKVRVYKPVDSDNLPLLMYFHGGGFVIGDIESHDLICRRLAKQSNYAVVSVDYRLAPEYPFPIPCEDSYAATVWAVENAASLGINPGRVAVMGDSAGGTLATVVSMMARDRGGPKIACQILIYPNTDITLSMDSVDRFGKGYFLTKEIQEWFNRHYRGNEKNPRHPYLSPLFAENLENLPPSLIVTCEYDLVKDEGEAYAKRLKEAGNKVVFIEYKGMIHTFFEMPKFLKAARSLEARVATMLNQIEH